MGSSSVFCEMDASVTSSVRQQQPEQRQQPCPWQRQQPHRPCPWQHLLHPLPFRQQCLQRQQPCPWQRQQRQRPCPWRSQRLLQQSVQTDKKGTAHF